MEESLFAMLMIATESTVIDTAMVRCWNGFTLCQMPYHIEDKQMGDTENTTLPQGVELTALDENFRKDPYPVLHDVRQRAPVLDDQQLRRLVYTRHDDVKTILRHKDLLSDPRKANPGSFTREYLGANMGEDDEPSMLLMDEPGHRRLRSLVSAPFTPAANPRSWHCAIFSTRK